MVFINLREFIDLYKNVLDNYTRKKDEEYFEGCKRIVLEIDGDVLCGVRGLYYLEIIKKLWLENKLEVVAFIERGMVVPVWAEWLKQCTF